MEEEKKIIDLEEYNKIRENPYEYILKWADKNLICVGRQAFKIIALQPSSLFLPDVSSSIISNISNFVIGNPGDGKSSLSKMYAKLCFNPLVRRKITEADLIATVSDMKWVSIAVEDLAQSANDDYGVIKAFEGILGEERSIAKSTLRDKYLGEVKGIALFGVTPQDLETFAKELESGLLSRCVVTLIKLTREDRKKISEFITLHAGDSEHIKELNKLENIVIEFYEELKMILRGKHKEYLEKTFGKDNNKPVIPSIKGYKIQDSFKKQLLHKWNAISNRMQDNGQIPNNRDLFTYYKFLVSLSFLNIHRREHTDGILVPNEEDHKIALELALENMKWKWAIPLALKYNRRATNYLAFEKLINDGLPEAVKDVMISTSPYGKYLMDKNV